jgi:lysophospholipase L1-like esterase
MHPTFFKKLALILVLLGFLVVALSTYEFFSPQNNAFLTVVLSGFLYILVVDLFFRGLVRYKTGRNYRLIPKLPFDKMYVEPHPYLTFAYKKNFLTQKSEGAYYPLNSDKGYSFGQSHINNLGFINGPDGGREIIIPKPEGLFRIHCLGASSTGNRIAHKGVEHSYPLHLEKILREQFPEKAIEVNNSGIGGYTTAEILITYLLKIFDAKPDLVVIYHGYNDLGPSLTPDFQSDYSHARRNFGETYYKYKKFSNIPYIPIGFINFFINVFFPQNSRYALIPSISRGKANINTDFKGLATYARNIEHIINICKNSQTKVVLSTFCHHLYKDIENDPVHLKYHEGVLQENEIMRELARKHSIPLVDNQKLIPLDDRYFVDSIHFSPEGMKEIANNLSKPIMEYIYGQKNLA